MPHLISSSPCIFDTFLPQDKLKNKVNAGVMGRLENAESEYIELSKKKMVHHFLSFTSVMHHTSLSTFFAISLNVKVAFASIEMH
jgi:hypothetical protein